MGMLFTLIWLPIRKLVIRISYIDKTRGKAPLGPHVRCTSISCVIIHGVKLIKEAFSNPLLCGRPPILTLSERTAGTMRGK